MKKFITLCKYRLYDQTAAVSFVTEEPLMKHGRQARLEKIGPTAVELSFEMYEAVLVDSGATPLSEVKSERIQADDAMRERAEGIIKSLRTPVAQDEAPVGGGEDAPLGE